MLSKICCAWASGPLALWRSTTRCNWPLKACQSNQPISPYRNFFGRCHVSPIRSAKHWAPAALAQEGAEVRQQQRALHKTHARLSGQLFGCFSEASQTYWKKQPSMGVIGVAVSWRFGRCVCHRGMPDLSRDETGRNTFAPIYSNGYQQSRHASFQTKTTEKPCCLQHPEAQWGL